MFRLPASILSLGLLAGCALPVPVQIASWAADGLSLITTRKSLADHGLSLIAQQDCAIWRGIVGKTVCITDDAGIIAVASNSPTTDTGDMAAGQGDAVGPAIAATSGPSFIAEGNDTDPASPENNFDGIESFVTAAGVSEPSSGVSSPSITTDLQAPVVTVPPPPPPLQARTVKPQKVADRFYVIGRFMRASEAKRMAGHYAQLGPEVVETRDDGGRAFKVMVGPFSSDHQNEVKGHILRTGINNIRIAHMDGSERFVARYYSIAAGNDKISTPVTAGDIHIDVKKTASFARYKKALLNFFGV